MTLLLPARRPLQAPPFTRNDLWRRARAVPGLDLRFANDKSLVDRISGRNLITFTRSSSGTYVDSAGVLQTAASGVPCFDHDPVTGESLGLRVEEQRTNSIRNNTMAGAVAASPGATPTNWVVTGTSGGVTRTIVGTGVDSGIAYIDIRYEFSSSGNAFVNFEPATQVAAASGQSWTASHYCKLQSGSTSSVTLATNVIGYSAAGAALEITPRTVFTPSGAALATQRYAHTRTLNNASTAYVTSNIAITATDAADITLRIGMPQLERGAFATSVIPTTTAAATRNADVAEIINTAIANGIRTLYAEFRSPASGTSGVVSLNDNTANERAAINTSGTDPRLVVVDGGVTQADIGAGTIAANASSRMAVRINANDFSASFNGGAVVTDTSGSLPTVDRLFIGRSQAGEYLNAPIARLTGWREALPDSVLQELTR